MMTLTYTESPSYEEEAILIEGLSQEAARAKGVAGIRPFAFFVRDSKMFLLRKELG